MIVHGGRIHDLKVSPGGDEVTMTPSEAPQGRVWNSHAPWRATVYGDLGFLEIGSASAEPVALPEGEWKLLTCTVDMPGGSGADSKSPPAWITAGGTPEYEAVEVVRGQTTELPFGSPYRAVVTTSTGGDEGVVDLSLHVVGAGGEVCSDIRVDGKRPDAPSFLIIDPSGEVVKRGEFEYG